MMWRIARTLATVLALAVLVVYAAIPSRLFYYPQAVEIEGTVVRVFRTFPSDWLGFPRPWIRYYETVTSENNRVCSDTGAHFYVSTMPSKEWDIAGWALPCMSGTYTWATDWVVYLGPIPLRPVSLSLVVFDGVAE